MSLARCFVCGLVLCSPLYAQADSRTEPGKTERAALVDSPLPKAAVPPSASSVGAIENSEPKKKSELAPTTKLWIALSLAVYTAAALDMHTTQDTANRVRRVHQQYPFFQLNYSFESNPIARPFLKLPPPAYYACGIAFATGINWVGFRMSRSKRFRKVWWLPQALSVAGNLQGYSSYQ